MADKKAKVRVKALIDRNIRDIVTFELRDPKIGYVSINEIAVNADNLIAKVYVSFLGAPHPHSNFKELEKMKGYVRSSLAKRMNIYKVPDIVFVYDDSFEKIDRLNAVLAKEAEDIENAKKGGNI